jgi:ABC-type branched-subunit amino acid transport system ATPase component
VSAVRLDGVSHRFGAMTVLKPLSLNLEPGARHGIIGPNGAGKSTLLNIIDGTLTPTSGEVYLFGQRISGLATHQRARMGIGRVFQTPQLCGRHTAHTNVFLALAARHMHATRGWPLGRKRRQHLHDETDLALGQAGLRRVAYHGAGRLSHGHRRQLEIAVAMAAQPSLLLLDEPTAGLSHHDTDIVVDVLAGLPATITLIVVEHDQDTLRRLTTTHTQLQPAPPPEEPAR